MIALEPRTYRRALSASPLPRPPRVPAWRRAWLVAAVALWALDALLPFALLAALILYALDVHGR